MKWEEIEKKYKGEWVFIEVTKASKDHEVLEGNVLCHDTDEKAFWEKVEPLQHKAFTIRYLGEFPEDLAVML